MISGAIRLAALVGLLAAPAAGQDALSTSSAAPAAGPAVVATVALRPRLRPEDGHRRCTPDGRICIAQVSYALDVCRTIEAAALSSALDAGFFARLLWRESLFEASAVSPAGAQGIAQFMPGTAALRGLSDPFNPAESILASADYLKELEGRFGNLGLAAAAYNAGEERVTRYLAGSSGLPGETRAYVLAITGHPADAWRDGPDPVPDYALDPALSFQEACLARAERRTMPTFEPKLLPWGVFLAAQGSREAVERQARRLAQSHAVLSGEQIDYARTRLPGQPGRRHVAQVGRNSRGEAEALCANLRSEGAACMVLRN